MARKKPGKASSKARTGAHQKAGSVKRLKRQIAGAPRGADRPLLRRVLSVAARPAVRLASAPMAAPAPAADDVPQATIDKNGGAVTVEIAFGHAQHGTYTIQLFDPTGKIELTRETGVSTDTVSDRFVLQRTPTQLDQHLVQWSGAVDAFTPAPGQQFSVLFDVSQAGAAVPGGHKEKSGPLNTTQAFLGILRLVLS